MEDAGTEVRIGDVKPGTRVRLSESDEVMTLVSKSAGSATVEVEKTVTWPPKMKGGPRRESVSLKQQRISLSTMVVVLEQQK